MAKKEARTTALCGSGRVLLCSVFLFSFFLILFLCVVKCCSKFLIGFTLGVLLARFLAVSVSDPRI